MIDFQLDEQQKALRTMAHEFAEREIRPAAPIMDETQEMDWRLVARAGELGFNTCLIPAAYGGTDVGMVTLSLIAEELGWGDGGFAVSMSEDWCSSAVLALYGSEDQKRRWFPRIVEQPGKVTGNAITEPNSGSDVSSMTTEARRVAGGYAISGTKRFITNGGEADFYVVFATMNRAARHKGITTFVFDGAAPGLSRTKKERKMGLGASPTGELLFENVFVPEKDRISDEGQGFYICMKLFDYGRVMIGGIAVGLARAAYEAAARYAAERQQFGQPIGFNQGIGFKLADMCIDIEASRQLVWLASRKADLGEPFSREAAMAKAFATDTVVRVTGDAVQVHGGYGYMKDYPVEKWMRDAKIFQVFIGTNEIQRHVLARSILKGEL